MSFRRFYQTIAQMSVLKLLTFSSPDGRREVQEEADDPVQQDDRTEHRPGVRPHLFSQPLQHRHQH